MPRRYVQLDVFASRPGAGNPLAVVLDASGLDDAAMQAIARWTRLPETTFVFPPSSPEASYGIRIFSPRREVPFAGHPSVGTAHAVLEAGIAAPRDGLLVQEGKAGLLPLRVSGGGRERTIATPDPFGDPWGYRGFGYRPYYGRYYGGFGRYRSPFFWGWHDPFWGSYDVESYTLYTSFLELDIRRRSDGQSLFEGRAQARSRTNELPRLVPNLVEAMFTGFPGNSGETLRITVMPEREQQGRRP